MPDSNDLASIPADPNNPLTADKIALGKMLFHETGLGIHSKYAEGVETYSCASCHHAAAGFQAGTAQGIGDGGSGFGMSGEARVKDASCPEDSVDVQPLRSPAALNVAYQTNMLWNGQFGATGVNIGTENLWTPGTPLAVNALGFEGVETQAIAGLSVHRLQIDQMLLDSLGYIEYFDNAYGSRPVHERYTIETAGLAIAAYERSLLATQSPFQQWLKGNRDIMSNQEKEGAALFFAEANCSSCHTGPALNSMAFYALGMDDLSDNDLPIIQRDPNSSANLGRAQFTGAADDMHKFKVPQLYNLTNSPHYGHGSSFHTVRDVVAYKNEGQKETPNVSDDQIATDFEPLGLTEDEIAAITVFIEQSLYDDNLQRYSPVSLPSENCFPNADLQSSIDMGCD